MPRSLAEERLRGVVTMTELRDTIPIEGKLTIINAHGDGNEVVTRAWCAEHGKNIIVWINDLGLENCLACVCAVAERSTGLNVHIDIWSN
jgi:hypothetical protein